MPPKQMVVTRLPPHLVASVDVYAQRQGKTRTDAVQDLLDRALRQFEVPGASEAAVLQELHRREITMDELGLLLESDSRLRQHGLDRVKDELNSLWAQYQQDRRSKDLQDMLNVRGMERGALVRLLIDERYRQQVGLSDVDTTLLAELVELEGCLRTEDLDDLEITLKEERLAAKQLLRKWRKRTVTAVGDNDRPPS